MNKKVYIFLADGFEDIEGLTVVDLMRRADIDIKNSFDQEIKRDHNLTWNHHADGPYICRNRFHGCGYAGTSGRNAGNKISE